MHISIDTRHPVVRQCETDFIVPILADILGFGPFGQPAAEAFLEHDLNGEAVPEEFLVGRVWAERLDWSEAEECRFPIFAICDAASTTWLQVFETLTKNGRRLRRDLNLDSFVQDVLFVHEFLIHPEVTDRIALLDPVLKAASSSSTLILTYHDQGMSHHLSDAEYRDLGFKKIARSNLLLRDNRFRYPFAEEFPAGREVEFEANAEHEAWLRGQWELLIADNPAT